MAALFVMPMAAQAVVVTTPFSVSYSVGANGVSRTGSTSNARFAYVGGNATTGANSTVTSFVVYEVSGASVLQQFRDSIYDNNGTVTSVSALSLRLYDEATTGVAGGFNFSFASATTQLGPTIDLGSGAYTPATVMNTALPVYAIGSTAVLAANNAGENFRIVVDANTATTRATLSGYFGLSPFITPPSLSIEGTAVPEPASLAVLGLGGLALLARRRSV